MGSLALAISAAHSFSVLGCGEFLLIGVAIITPLLICFQFLKGIENVAIAALHLIIAIAIHPEVTFKTPLYLSTPEQFELLQRIHQAGDSWWGKADMAYDLARSLKTEAVLQLEISSPFWYWVFPPSLVFAIWGVVFFFHFPKNDSCKESS
jgi:hypothetical protein